MGNMNAGIILAGQAPDIGGSMAQGINNANAFNTVNRQNALADLYQSQGAGILAGDQNALNALAGHDPAAALGIQQTQQGMQFAENQDARLTRAEQRQVAQQAAGLSAAELTQQTQAWEDAIAMGMAANSPQEWDAIVGQSMPELVGQFENRPALVNKAIGIVEVMKLAASAEPTDEYGRYAAEEQAAGRQPLTRIEFAHAKRGAGTVVYGPDGTPIVSIGGQGGVVPTGQNTDTTATPRDADTLMSKLSEADAAAIRKGREAAVTAETLGGIAEQLEVLAPKVGYTGPGGGIYGAVDDLVGFLPGDEGARGAFRSLSTEAQLTFTEKTKGAISEKEMALFAAAVPSLRGRPEANMLVAQILRAGAARVQTRSNFMEAWAGKRGSLQGANEAWQAYRDSTAILVEDANGNLSVQQEGDWRAYIGRQASVDLTPEVIGGMAIEELKSLEGQIPTMTIQQLDAYEAAIRPGGN